MAVGAFMEFSPLLATGDPFDLPEEFKTASVCPVPGTSASYTIQILKDGAPFGVVSPDISDVTSFPQTLVSGGWCSHRIICTAGNVIVKYQTSAFNNSGQ